MKRKTLPTVMQLQDAVQIRQQLDTLHGRLSKVLKVGKAIPTLLPRLTFREKVSKGMKASWRRRKRLAVAA